MTLLSKIVEKLVRSPRYELKMHFAPSSRVERDGRWHPGFHEVDKRGKPILPRITRKEATERAKKAGATPVFHETFDDARAASLVLPGE